MESKESEEEQGLTMEPVLLLYALLTLFIIVLLHVFLSRKLRRRMLPPGPMGIPILGNILEIGNKPNESLQRLSTRYGPLMTLTLGWKTLIVVSSAEMAKEVYKTHDKDLSGRDPSAAIKLKGNNKRSMIWGEPDEHWRMLRRISNMHLFSAAKLQSLQHIRASQIRLTIREIYNKATTTASEGLNFRDIVLRSSLNLLGKMAFSRDMFGMDSPEFRDFQENMHKMIVHAGQPNIADFFPVLGWIDPQGVARRSLFYRERAFSAFDKMIHNRVAERGAAKRVESESEEKDRDLLDTLLDLCGQEFTVADIRRYLTNDSRDVSLSCIHEPAAYDIFVGGTDTTLITMEWAMAELIRNPAMMKKVQMEIDELVGCERLLEETDTEKLPYLQAVIKETLRLHPATPLLIPHKAERSCEIQGFLIPKHARIVTNYWAIARDPALWEKPLEFKPERFMHSNSNSSKLEFKGQNFEFIPFGSGRRICMGLPLANIMLHTLLGAMIQSFHWSPLPGICAQDIDMADEFGFTMRKLVPLKAIPSPRLPPHVFF